jgi:hypothetical protein
MQDKEYNKLKIHMTIMPESHKWPPPNYTHWEKLHRLADEARELVAKAFKAMDEIDHNPDLSAEGKVKERAKLAEQAITNFHKSKALENARDAVERQQRYWAAKTEQAFKPAEDPQTVALHAQIRDRITNMKEGRLAFIDKHIAHPAVVSAVLTAPAFLSGLSDVELGVIRQKVEKRVLSAEVAEAKATTEKALLAAEKGWERAVDVIAERGGLIERGKQKAAA